MKRNIMILLVALLGISAASTPKGTSWKKLLQECELEFTPPKEYKEVPTRENKDLHYVYAMKHKTLDIEVRYSIMPLKEIMEEYNSTKGTEGKVQVNPNTLYRTFLMVNIMNVSQQPTFFEGGAMPEINDFPKEAVRQEFNADAGSTGAFSINEERTDYGTGYAYGMMFILQKDDVASVTVCFLSNDLQVMEDNILSAFHSLKFKK